MLPLAVRVTEYQMDVRRCAHCGKRTRAALPQGVPRRPFGPRLVAVLALLTGRYRLSRREVQQALQDLWAVRLSLGAVVRQEQAQSAALAPVVAEVRAAVQQAAVVNMDETGWRQAKQRAWLWTVVLAELTVFQIDRRRGGAVVDALLGAAYAGVVGSDRWFAYNRSPPSDGPCAGRTSNGTSRAWWIEARRRGPLAAGAWRRSSGSSRSGTASEPASSTAQSCNGDWCRSRRGWGGCCGAGRRARTGRQRGSAGS